MQTDPWLRRKLTCRQIPIRTLWHYLGLRDTLELAYDQVRDQMSGQAVVDDRNTFMILTGCDNVCRAYRRVIGPWTVFTWTPAKAGCAKRLEIHVCYELQYLVVSPCRWDQFGLDTDASLFAVGTWPTGTRSQVQLLEVVIAYTQLQSPCWRRLPYGSVSASRSWPSVHCCRGYFRSLPPWSIIARSYEQQRVSLMDG